MWTNFDVEAAAIAEAITRKAIPYKDRVNWIARDAPDRVDPNRPEPSASSLDPTLHSGIGGILQFLTNLDRTDSAQPNRATAKAAIREIFHQYWQQASLPKSRRAPWQASPWGYFHGALGPLWATDQAIQAYGFRDLEAHQAELAAAALRRNGTEGGFDAMSGIAGAIPIIADWASRGVPDANATLLRLGRFLTKSSQKRSQGITWEKVDSRWVDGLTGYSHGNAGIAHAYAALYTHTSDERFRALAQAATQYEASHYVAEQQNWADLRNPAGPSGHSCELAWCHGAPGIGLGRVALLDAVPGHPAWQQDLQAAFATTESTLKDFNDTPGAAYILCHGAAGVAECHRAMARRLEATPTESRKVAALGVELFGSEATRTHGRYTAWPLGPPGSSQPGLLKGLAGIGHFLLNTGHPEIPSPLASGNLVV